MTQRIDRRRALQLTFWPKLGFSLAQAWTDTVGWQQFWHFRPDESRRGTWRCATRRLSVTNRTKARKPLGPSASLRAVRSVSWGLPGLLTIVVDRCGRVISPETKQAVAIGGSCAPPGVGQHPGPPHLHELPAHLLAAKLHSPQHPNAKAHYPRRSGPAVDTAEGCFRSQNAE